MPLTPFDFQQARVKQVLFKSRLRSVLYGVREAEPGLFAAADNPLAQWLRTTLRPALGPAPGPQAEARELDHTLQQMLQAGQALTARYQRGHIEEARAGLDQVNALADRIEALLLRLEQGLALG